MNYRQRKIKRQAIELSLEDTNNLFEKYPTVKGQEITLGNVVICGINQCEETKKFFKEQKSYRQCKIEARKILKKRGII